MFGAEGMLLGRCQSRAVFDKAASMLNGFKEYLLALSLIHIFSLATGGMPPDPRGDEGVYTFRYAFLPHTGGFCA